MNEFPHSHAVNAIAAWSADAGLTGAVVWIIENMMTIWCIVVLALLVNTLRWIASVRNSG